MVTYNHANPPFNQWIKTLMNTLHEDPELKKLCPKLPIVTRQPPSVASCALKSKHWQRQPATGPDPDPPGCHRLHRQRLSLLQAVGEPLPTGTDKDQLPADASVRVALIRAELR